MVRTLGIISSDYFRSRDVVPLLTSFLLNEILSC